jgi:hypothetical protein
MWPATLVYVLSSDEQRKAIDQDRHTHRVVRHRRQRGRRSTDGDV